MKKAKQKKYSAALPVIGCAIVLVAIAAGATLPPETYVAAKIPATSSLFLLGLGLMFLKLRRDQE